METAGPDGQDAPSRPDPIVPAFESEDAYLEAVMYLEPWQGVIAAIVEREAIAFDGEPVVKTDYKAPMFHLPPDHYLKLFLDWRDRPRSFAAERAAYRIVAADPGLPVPTLVADGYVGATCRYLVITRIAGQSLRSMRDTISLDEMIGIATWTGEFMRRIHSVPIDAHERRTGWEAFSARMQMSRRSTVRSMTKRGALTPRLISQLDAWLPSAEEMLGEEKDAVLVHGALRYEHVYVDRVDGTYVPSGVIDLGSARVAHPMFDLTNIWSRLHGEPPEVGEHLLATAGLPDYGSDFPRMALAWAIIQRWTKIFTLPDIEDIATLDELAQRIYAPRLRR